MTQPAMPTTVIRELCLARNPGLPTLCLTSEENIPMSSWSWLRKKRRNAVFPAAESQSKTEAWVQAVVPSSSQVTEESLRSDVEPKSQTTIISSVPLPGSVIDHPDEMQAHSLYVAKSSGSDAEAGHGEAGQGQSFFNKLGFNKNKSSFVKCLNEWKGNKTAAQKGHPSSPRVLSHDNQLGGCLSKEEQPYIPYRLAKLYITKIAKDMQQMKTGYVKVIKELEHAGKENKEQAIMELKNQYGNKMKILRDQLGAYQELVDKKNQYWQDTMKRLKEENMKLRQEKEELASQIILQREKWDKERAYLLKSTTQKLDSLYTQHTLTVEELQRSRLNLEKVQKIVNFQMDLPYDQRRALIISDE
ncbi:hypothetical protein lerEdw1_000136, partial [Lerista edwardsae]